MTEEKKKGTPFCFRRNGRERGYLAVNNEW